MIRLRELTIALTLGIVSGGCSSAPESTTIERVRLPRASDETATQPVRSARWTMSGTLPGGLEFERVCVFLAPNQYAERTTLRGVDVSTTRLWDGTSFFERLGDSQRKLDAQAARVLFDRAMEAAVLFRQSDAEPSLAVERITERAPGTETRPAAQSPAEDLAPAEDRGVDVYRVSHGRAGFDRALDFDSTSARLVAMRGSRHVEGKPLPLDCVIRFSEHRAIEGRSLPFAYTLEHDGEVLETGRISEYRIDALPADSNLLAWLDAP